jgi:hypothetical protein
VGLPDLGIPAVHAKIDTGATTSALHAEVIDVREKGGLQIVRFLLPDIERSGSQEHAFEAELLDHRRVKSSSGHYSSRPVIFTHVAIGGRVWSIEITLANRETMGVPMLLGRQSLKNRFVVDPARSYLLSKKKKRPPQSPTSH